MPRTKAPAVGRVQHFISIWHKCKSTTNKVGKEDRENNQVLVLITKSALKKAVLRFSDSVHIAGAATAAHWVNCNAREGSCEKGMVGTLLANPPSWRNGLGEAEGKGGSVTRHIPHILFDKWCPREGNFRKGGPETKSSGSEAYMKVGEK